MANPNGNPFRHTSKAHFASAQPPQLLFLCLKKFNHFWELSWPRHLLWSAVTSRPDHDWPSRFFWRNGCNYSRLQLSDRHVMVNIGSNREYIRRSWDFSLGLALSIWKESRYRENTETHLDRQRANDLPQPVVWCKIRRKSMRGICCRMVAPSNDLCERLRHHPKTDAARALAASTVRFLTISRRLRLFVNVFQINKQNECEICHWHIMLLMWINEMIAHNNMLWIYNGL